MKSFLAGVVVFAAMVGFTVMWNPARWATSVPQIAIYGLFITWAVSAPFRRRALKFVFPALPITGLLAIGATQLALHWTVYRWETWESMLYWLTNLLAISLAADLCCDPVVCRRALNGMFLAGAILAILAVIQEFTTDGYVFWAFAAPYREEVYGPFVYRNQYAAFLELLLPMALYRALASKVLRWPYLTLAAGLYASSVASHSRAGVVLATLEPLVVGFLLLKRKLVRPRQLAYAGAWFLASAGVFVAVVGPEVVWTRLQQPDPYSSRRDLETASAAMFRSRPLRGFGLGNWPTAYPSFAVDDDGLFANQAHNDWAQAAVEGGIFGFSCLAVFFAWSVRAGWKSVWGLGIPIVLVHALVDYPIQRQAIAVYFFLLVGVQWAALRQSTWITSADSPRGSGG